MNRHAIFHSPCHTSAYPAGPGCLRVTLRAARGDLRSVTALYHDRYMGPESSVREPLRLEGRDELFDYWTGEMRLDSARFAYHFALDDGQQNCLYGEGGFSEPGTVPAEFQLAYAWWASDTEPPDWAQDAIVYHIFPDRFARGNQHSSPPGSRTWGESPQWDSVFGGDLQGITAHIDHLYHLGINCLYLNPIFRSSSNHKYDTTDYLSVDSALGTTQDLHALVNACHDRGIRIVFDAVFNHSGFEFRPFQDLAAREAASTYADWFSVRRFPIERGRLTYESFASVWSMPKLRTDNPAVQEYLIRAAEYWTREFGVDGWRLDVANEVHPEFWRQFRRRIRAINPQALIIGEIWHEASSWLQGDQLDGVTNYPWRELCLKYFTGNLDAAGFAEGLTRTRMRYRRSVTGTLWNLLDSHDTERLLSVGGMSPDEARMAVAFQFTYPGAPVVYYGDEVGLRGGNDPDCRRCMPWDTAEWDSGMLKLYVRLAWLRRQHAVLRRGEFSDLTAECGGGVYTFARWDESSCAIVSMNRSSGQAVVSGEIGRLLAEKTDGRYGAGRYELAFTTAKTGTATPPHLSIGEGEGRGLVLPPHSAAVYILEPQ